MLLLRVPEHYEALEHVELAPLVHVLRLVDMQLEQVRDVEVTAAEWALAWVDEDETTVDVRGRG